MSPTVGMLVAVITHELKDRLPEGYEVLWVPDGGNPIASSDDVFRLQIASPDGLARDIGYSVRELLLSDVASRLDRDAVEIVREIASFRTGPGNSPCA